jgi:hypothetical protein
MSRQLRLSTLEQIKKRSKDLIGKKINIVMRNRTVFFGELKSFDITKLTFLNMRQQPVTVLLKEIDEVYLDYKD